MKAREWIEVGAGLSIAVLLAGFMILGAGMMGIPGHVSSQSPEPAADPLQTYNNSVTLAVPLPASPLVVPSYRVSDVKKLTFRSPKTQDKKASIPSGRDAPALAARGLAPYGGLPADAGLERSQQVFWKNYNATTGRAEETFPQYTRVLFRKQVNGSPVMGTLIEVRLGEDGEILDLVKEWCTLEPSGEIAVIPAEEALEKLNRQDLLEKLQCCVLDSTITRVEFGYFVDLHTPDAPVQSLSPYTCTPVWIFYGVKPGTDEDPFPLIVNATRG
ncbi:hypothetical protein [Methanoregula sp.]|uniref:hypothetical protein n=1 Tax=Methanoregula sp. TaxID=2052170 RepID=UPI0035621A4E